MIKLTGFLLIFSVALTLYTFIDCARRDETEIQKLPKWGWLLIILFFQVVGPIAYLVIGRNPLKNLPKRKPQKRILPPDDDPDFLRKI